MAIDPVTGSVILGGLQGLGGALGGGEQRRSGLHDRYMDRRDANIQDLDRRAQYERRAARSPGSGHLLQQLAERLGITMPEGAFGGSREAVPGAVSGKYMPGNRQSAFGQAYPSPQAPPPPPVRPPQGSMAAGQAMGGAASRGAGMADLLKMYLGRRES